MSKIGDRNRVFSFHDYWEGVTEYVRQYQRPPNVLIADTAALGDMKRDEHYISEQDIIKHANKDKVLLQYAVYYNLADGGEGVYDNRPVYHIAEKNDYPTVRLAEERDSNVFVMVEG